MKEVKMENNDKELIISKYFNMWVSRNFVGLNEIFDEDIYYSECYGPEYFKMEEIKLWIENMLRKQIVKEWIIKRFIHTDNVVVVEWYFKEEQKDHENDFDGVSIIEFNELGKIVKIKEYESKVVHKRPYK